MWGNRFYWRWRNNFMNGKISRVSGNMRRVWESNRVERRLYSDMRALYNWSVGKAGYSVWWHVVYAWRRRVNQSGRWMNDSGIDGWRVICVNVWRKWSVIVNWKHSCGSSIWIYCWIDLCCGIAWYQNCRRKCTGDGSCGVRRR